MDNSSYCQSCSMPLDGPELWGTEKDGSPNREYCKFCYQHGVFTNPDLTLEEMKTRMISRMDADQLPPDILEAAINRLEYLKRWQSPVK